MQTLCLMDLLKTQLQEIETQMNEHLQHIPQAGYMCSIPGLGPISVASILGETGPFEAYQAPEQLIKLAGLNLFEISSGYKKGTRRIAKRGRARLRRILYTAVFPLIFHNPIFKEAYHRFKGAGKPTQKAIIALSCKLLRILFALVNKQETFNINGNTKKEKVVSQVKKAA
jgi:transposase